MFSTKNNSEVEEVDATMYGQCRCCLVNGQHRDVTKEYYYSNMKEVYKDIFLECFNLSLSPHNLISSLICEKCVHRLRDASRFRMMVSATEANLLKAIIFKSEPDDDTDIVDDQQNFATEIKIESAEENFDMEEEFSQESSEGSVFSEGTNEDEWMSDGERMNEDERKEYERMIEQRMKEDDEDDDCSTGSSDNELVIDETREIAYSDSDTDDDVDGVGNDGYESTYSSIAMSTTSALDDEPCEIIEGEQKLLCRFPTSPPQPLPKRNELRDLCPLYNQHLLEFGEKIVKPESIGWYFKLPELNEKLLSERQALTVNASTIFEYSNATAFKTKTRKGYTCFYCREAYKFDKLKEHQKKHSKTSISKLLSKFNADEFVVYADITNLKCTICKKKIKSLKKLKKHLTKKHGRKIYPSADRVIPFKLTDTDFECQKCGRKFDTFCAVEKHMNTHFGTFKCRDCEATFITKHRLAVHNYDQHKDEKVICEVCKKSFRTQLKYRQHYDGVHKNIKKLKCTQCPEKFIDFFTRQKHLVDVHSEAPLLYKCNVCDKGFNRRFSLSSHVKRCHTDKKNMKCLECPYTCYTKSELKDHMIKHQTPQKFECPICKKTYGRNRTLATHLKTHKDHT